MRLRNRLVHVSLEIRFKAGDDLCKKDIIKKHAWEEKEWKEWNVDEDEDFHERFICLGIAFYEGDKCLLYRYQTSYDIILGGTVWSECS